MDQYESEEEQQYEQRKNEKLVGPPLELEFPLRPPPGQPPNEMNMVQVSNIMGIEPKSFNRKEFFEEKTFETDEYGTKKWIRLKNKIDCALLQKVIPCIAGIERHSDW